MLKYNQLEKVKYNQLDKIKYNSESKSEIQLFSRLSSAKPIVYSQDNERLDLLENAYEIIIDQEVDGIDKLSFFLPFTDHKKENVKNENIIELADRRYIIRRVRKIRSGNELEIEISCEATWYDLQKAEPMKVYEWENATPREMLTDMLAGTDWDVGIVEIEDERNLALEDAFTNRLKGMNELPDVFDGELKFRPKEYLVDFVEPIGKESGASIVYQKNMNEIEAEYSTEELTTKLYLYGKENMTIEDAHPDGLEYIENYQYTDKVIVAVMKDERFTNPYHLYDKGINALKILSRPTGSYLVKMSDLSNLTGMEHESFELGDSIWVYDKELEIDDKKRIMKWKYNVSQPEETEVELESKQPTLSDLLSGIQDGNSFLESEDSVDKDDMLNLSVFNYLLNSRADDGFSYWQNTGWEIDPVNGYSGNSSFRAKAESGVKKELKQIVYPSHREEYSISFRANTDQIKVGNNGEVGIYVKIKYDDGTEDEPVFISLIEGD